jgi:hypothetical protein
MACSSKYSYTPPFLDFAKGCAQVKNLVSGRIFQDTCDVFISASGALNDWKWPKIPGLHSFKGKLLHSANWDENYDYSVHQPFPGIKSLLTELSEQKSCSCWCRLKWNPNCPRRPTHGKTPRPSCPRQNLDCHYFRSRQSRRTRPRTRQLYSSPLPSPRTIH